MDSALTWQRSGGRLRKVLDPGTGDRWTPWRRYPFLILVHVHSGTFVAEILREGTVRTGPGATLALPQLLPNRVRSDGGCTLSYSHLRFSDARGLDALSGWAWPRSFAGRAGAALGAAVVRLEEDWQRLAYGPLALRRTARLQRTAMDLLLLLLDAGAPAGGGPAASCHPALPAVFDALAARLHEPLTRAALARLARLPPARFTRLFRQATGETPMAYLERQRLERALDRLTTTGDPIQDIAADVGFADPFHFSRRFRHRFGISPRAARAAQGP